VHVVARIGIGKNMLARETEDVGHRGAVFVAVTAVPGTGCIGAYFVRLSCRLYGIPQSPSSMAPVGAVVATSLVESSPVVPDTCIRAVAAASEKTPIIPVRVNRGEKFVTVPPWVAVDIMPRKLQYC
jgi:hypothetical protein